jgi:hypothetical protein
MSGVSKNIPCNRKCVGLAINDIEPRIGESYAEAVINSGLLCTECEKQERVWLEKRTKELIAREEDHSDG